MPRQAQVQLRTYRNHRLEVRDDGDEGWCVVIHGAGGAARSEILHNRVADGLRALMDEARCRVDRKLDDDAPMPSSP